MPTVQFGKRPGRTRGRPGNKATADGKVILDDWQTGHVGTAEVWDMDTDAADGALYMKHKLHGESSWDYAASIAFDATTGAVETALEDMATITAVTVTGVAGAWVIQFDDLLGPGGFKVGDKSATDGSGNFATSTTTLVTEGIKDLDGFVSVEVQGDTNTYTLSYGGQTTGVLDEDDDAAALEVALELLSTITAVTVTGSGTRKDPFQVEFVNPVTSVGVSYTLGTWESTVVAANRASAPNSDRE